MLREFLYRVISFDIFTTNPTLMVNGSDSISTNISRFFTFIFLVMTSFIFTIYALSFLNLENYQITTIIKNLDRNVSTNISSNDIMMGIRFEHPELNNDLE